MLNEFIFRENKQETLFALKGIHQLLGNRKGTLLPSSQTRATFYVAIYISKKLETCLSFRGKI